VASVLTRRRAGKMLIALGAATAAAAIAIAPILAGKSGTTSESKVLANGVAAIGELGRGVGSFTKTPAVPGNVAVGEGGVWVVNTGGAQTVSRIDPKTHEVVKTVRLGRLTGEVAAGDGAVWVGTLGSRTESNVVDAVARIDPVSVAVTHSVKLPGRTLGALPSAGLPRLAVAPAASGRSTPTAASRASIRRPADWWRKSSSSLRR
jgi:hypothetical protein